MKPFTSLLAMALCLGSSLSILPASAATPPAPCATPPNRAFDFWLGEWTVKTPDGKLAGQNSIKSEYNGCVLHERYSTPGAYSGESLNIYDAARKVWHQTWVDNTGLLLVLEGGIKDGKMVLEGAGFDPKGAPVKHRITWSPNPDGSVRQLWESTDAAGKWSIAFDGHYTKK